MIQLAKTLKLPLFSLFLVLPNLYFKVSLWEMNAPGWPVSESRGLLFECIEFGYFLLFVYQRKVITLLSVLEYKLTQMYFHYFGSRVAK